MGANKEIFTRMRESDFNELSEYERSKFTYVEVRESNEYENNRSDPNYLKLYKAQKKAKDNLQKYLFNKRNK
jgi:hypothetical protein